MKYIHFLSAGVKTKRGMKWLVTNELNHGNKFLCLITCIYQIFFVPLQSQRFFNMAQEEAIKLFENTKVRIVWDDEKEKYFFSIVDVIQVLTDSVDGRKYWNKLKQRLREEGNESVTNCHQLKLQAADGKKYLTDVADTEQLLRLIQSIPSKKAEPFKRWMAKVAAERLNQLQDPELSIQQAMRDYKRLGYSDCAKRGVVERTSWQG